MRYQYVVVIRDQAKEWHAVAHCDGWDAAYMAFFAAANTLTCTDYYEVATPDNIKIVRSDGAGSDYYEHAEPLAGPID